MRLFGQIQNWTLEKPLNWNINHPEGSYNRPTSERSHFTVYRNKHVCKKTCFFRIKLFFQTSFFWSRCCRSGSASSSYLIFFSKLGTSFFLLLELLLQALLLGLQLLLLLLQGRHVLHQLLFLSLGFFHLLLHIRINCSRCAGHSHFNSLTVKAALSPFSNSSSTSLSFTSILKLMWPRK